MHLKEEGRHFRKSLQTADLLEAEERAQNEVINVLAKVQSGQRILALALRDLLRRFSLHQQALVESAQLSPKTVKVQEGRVRLGCDFLKTVYQAGLDTKLSSIDGSVFEGYLKWRQDSIAKKRESGTIRRDVVRDELLVIRKMFKFARKEHLCTDKSVPTWDFHVERDGPKRRRINVENFRDFINITTAWARESQEAKARYNALVLTNVIALVSYSGMRSGEAFGLKNKDIEKRGTTRGESTYVVTIRPETSKIRRGRQITVVDEVLGQWLAKHQRHRAPDDHLFSPYDDGKKDTRNVFYHAFRSLRVRLKEVDLDWFDLYHCRHWWITQRLLAEESIMLIADAAGTSVKEIQSTYSHVITELTTKRFGEKKVVWKPDGSYDIIKQLELE
jgi:integrase